MPVHKLMVMLKILFGFLDLSIILLYQILVWKESKTERFLL